MGTLLLYHLRRSWLVGMLAVLALFIFHFLVCRVFQQITDSGGVAPMARLMPRWVQSLFNVDPTALNSLSGFLSVAYQHPFVLIVMLAVPVTLATGLLAGEVERRTIGLVLARAVGRWQVVASTAIVSLAWPLICIAACMAGNAAGAWYSGVQEPIRWISILQVGLNLLALTWAFTGIALAISAAFDERGEAVGWCVTAVLVMYVWNFLAQLWSGSGGSLPNYSLFAFYAPASVLLRGDGVTVNLQVLLAVALGGLVVALLSFKFRDLSV